MDETLKLVLAGLTGGVGSALFGVVVATFREKAARRKDLARDIFEWADALLDRVTLTAMSEGTSPEVRELMHLGDYHALHADFRRLTRPIALLSRTYLEFGTDSAEGEALNKVQLRAIHCSTLIFQIEAIGRDQVCDWIQRELTPCLLDVSLIFAEAARPLGRISIPYRHSVKKVRALSEELEVPPPLLPTPTAHSDPVPR